MRVVVSSEPGTGRVSAVLMVRAGDADDPPGQAGANRVLSRLLVQASNHRAPGRFGASSVDGALWSDAEADVTSYSVITLPGEAASAIKMLSLVTEPPSWNNTTVMRNVQREGEYEREEAPEDWLHDFNAWQARAGLPYAPDTDAEPPSRETLRDLYTNLYVPDRMVLSVVGDVSADDVFAAAAAAFPGKRPIEYERPARKRLSLPEAPPPTGKYAFVGRTAPAASAPDAPAVEVIAAALGTGKTSAVFQQLREREGTGYESGVAYPKRLTTSAVALFSRAPANPAAARDDLERIWRSAGIPPDGGWASARARAAQGYLMQHQTGRDRAYWLAFWETAGQGAGYDAAYVERIRNVPDSAIAAAARRWFSGDPVVLPGR